MAGKSSLSTKTRTKVGRYDCLMWFLQLSCSNGILGPKGERFMELENMKAALYARVANMEQVDPQMREHMIPCGSGYVYKENSAPASVQEAPSQSE